MYYPVIWYGDCDKLVKGNGMQRFLLKTTIYLCQMWPSFILYLHSEHCHFDSYIHLSWASFLLNKNLYNYDSCILTVQSSTVLEEDFTSWSTFLKGEGDTILHPRARVNQRLGKGVVHVSRQIPPAQQFLGAHVFRCSHGGVDKPPKKWWISNRSQDCTGWRFSSWSRTSCQRCSKGYSRENPEKTTRNTDVDRKGKACGWGLCWVMLGFLGYLDWGWVVGLCKDFGHRAGFWTFFFCVKLIGNFVESKAPKKLCSLDCVSIFSHWFYDSRHDNWWTLFSWSTGNKSKPKTNIPIFWERTYFGFGT